MDKQKVIIFGTNDFAKRIALDIERDGKKEILAFCLDKDYIQQNTIFEKQVIPFEDLKSYYSTDSFELLICIGYSKMNTIYELVFKKAIESDYRIGNYISPRAIVKGAILGTGNIILENAYIGYGVELSNGNRIMENVMISHDVSVGNYNYFSPCVAVAGYSNIENNCFLGINSTIGNKVNIGSSSLIGAGAYISKNTEEHSVYVPERSIKLKYSSDEMSL